MKTNATPKLRRLSKNRGSRIEDRRKMMRSSILDPRSSILNPLGSNRGVRRLICVFRLEGLFVELNVKDRFDQPSLLDQLAVLEDLDFVWHQCVLDRLEIFEIKPVFNRSGLRVFVVGVDDAA